MKPIFAAALVNSLGAPLFTLYYLLFVRETINLRTAGIWFSIVAGSYIALAGGLLSIVAIVTISVL
jgi:hypothetical protein